MKKLFCLIASLILLLSLCGCSYKRIMTGSGAEYIISAIGFDRENEQIKITLEAVIINSEDAEADKKTSLLTGGGKTVDAAYADALKSATESVILSHSGAVIIGSTVSSGDFQNILDWFYQKQETTLSTFFISSPNAEELLSCETVSSVAVGYDIVGMLEQSSSESGTIYKNRFFQIESAHKSGLSTLALPFFSVNEQKFSLDGLQIYNHFSPALRLTRAEAFYYALATDNQTKGLVTLKNSTLNISSANTRYKTDVNNIEMHITLKTRQCDIPDNELKNGITQLYDLSAKQKIDIFSLEHFLISRGKEAEISAFKVIINE